AASTPWWERFGLAARQSSRRKDHAERCPQSQGCRATHEATVPRFVERSKRRQQSRGPARPEGTRNVAKESACSTTSRDPGALGDLVWQSLQLCVKIRKEPIARRLSKVLEVELRTKLDEAG